MKFNLMLFIIFCLLEALICSTDGLNEKSLIDAAIKTLKYFNEFQQKDVNTLCFCFLPLI